MNASRADSAGAVLYSRRGCTPCFAMRREAERASRLTGLPLRVVEITGDPDLEKRFGTEIPVLIIPGGESLRGRMVPGAVEAAFRRAQGSQSAVSHGAEAHGRASRPGGSVLGGLMSILGLQRRPPV